jgi:hypothetical protein
VLHNRAINTNDQQIHFLIHLEEARGHPLQLELDLGFPHPKMRPKKQKKKKKKKRRTRRTLRTKVAM